MRGQRHAPAALYPRERAGTHCTGGWVGPRAGLDMRGKSRLHRDSIPGPSSPQPVAIPTELPGPRIEINIYEKELCVMLVIYKDYKVKYLKFTDHICATIAALTPSMTVRSIIQSAECRCPFAVSMLISVYQNRQTGRIDGRSRHGDGYERCSVYRKFAN